MVRSQLRLLASRIQFRPFFNFVVRFELECFPLRDRKDVGKTLEKMKDDFIRSSLLYLKKPGFAANFVTRKHEEILAGAAARSARDRALRDAERQ
jgi:hypothetical protein